MIVTLAWLASCAAEMEEARAAVVTLVSVHSHFTCTHTRAITLLPESSKRVTCTLLAAAGAVGEVPFFTAVALEP